MNFIESLEHQLAQEQDDLAKSKREFKTTVLLCSIFGFSAIVLLVSILTFYYYPNIADGVGNTQSGKIVGAFGTFYVLCISLCYVAEILKGHSKVDSNKQAVDSTISQISSVREQIALNTIIGNSDRVRLGLIKTV